ncbi:hypothetical protein COT44_00120 [Candidatus Shapirobacteria bacterium CG08_land_8_20_14_0_20_39_18]|uniref:DNA polymerase III subunit delta n=1 Tax=Candidatus Shapirobacteria bacterium CG08_land_8_20_14_0_20_39_18 TaxID=1974883 RepID=A0A2M6XEG7_9BACT|nr:MAG: hypothetical protein COT44_00120 [Candidatus Shapirobacteria bacterium CG08_land_8_20_14_0_20_39_18]PIY66107.1 MAG: hypothetical protein COY91_01390 [Candidatus Shapirobacteria bacterium CG_4_10_14_0_8_um_filter_39_15]
MSAYLILGGDQDSRWSKVLELYNKSRNLASSIPFTLSETEGLPASDPDSYILSDPESIGISQIRELEKSLSLKPYGQPPKIAIIQAELMTFEAQTALLKTLEEPPGETIFFLHAPNANLLLPTILSRCQTIQLPAEPEIKLGQQEIELETGRLNQLLSVKPAQRLLLADEWGINKDKKQAIRFCQIQLVLWREILINNVSLPTSGIQLPTSNFQLLSTLKLITKTLKYLSANVNPKLALDNLLLSYPIKSS